ncbi:hypothetical protein BGW39_002753 [Mortierella sp. 14UC]|nr:hypothetical protein BGW39_002753 [Mortierella sp. 14UC]
MNELYQLHPTDNYLVPIDQAELSSSAFCLLNRIDTGTVVCSPRLQALLAGPQPQMADTLSTAFLAKDLKGFPLQVLTTKAIRTALLQEEPTEKEAKQLPHWRRFWKETLERRSRTVLWRYYQNKMSNGSDSTASSLTPRRYAIHAVW